MRYGLLALAALTAVQAAPIDTSSVTDLASLDSVPTGSVTGLAPRQDTDSIPDLASLDSLPTGSVTDLAPRQDTDSITDLAALDSLPTGSVTNLAPREEASEEDYLIQGPDYENADNDLLAHLFDPGYGEEDDVVKRDDPSDESGNVSIVDDLTHLDLTDLLNPNDANGDSSIV